MSRYLHLFQEDGDFREAYWGDYYGEPWVSYTVEKYSTRYNKKRRDILLQTPLTFEISSDGNVVWKTTTFGKEREIEYSLNGGEWRTIVSTTGEGVSISVVSGDTIQFKGDNTEYGIEANNILFNGFSGSTCGFKAYGNIMSLVSSTDFVNSDSVSSLTFFSLFYYCTGLTDATELILPAMTLGSQCYSYMFAGCTSLTGAPELPAKTMVYRCYNHMFYSCINLVNPPELPATTLASGCYQSMFNYCTSLLYTPVLNVNTPLPDSCYESMFKNCSSLSDLRPLQNWDVSNGVYYKNMFKVCSFALNISSSASSSKT